jgi:hypothetical protein
MIQVNLDSEGELTGRSRRAILLSKMARGRGRMMMENKKKE